jgi:hypothetical protein
VELGQPGHHPLHEHSARGVAIKDPQAQLKKQWVGYEESRNLKRALIAAEDAKFVDHEGFDWDGIQKAIEKNQKKGRVVAGGSTISQQLAKNLFLTPSKTPWRKAEEAIITLMLETVWSKQRIFEVYLNVIEWGNGVFGAEAAARHYYGISCRATFARAGGAPGRHGSQSALLRPQPQRARAGPQNGDHPRPHARRRSALSRLPPQRDGRRRMTGDRPPGLLSTFIRADVRSAAASRHQRHDRRRLSPRAFRRREDSPVAGATFTTRSDFS